MQAGRQGIAVRRCRRSRPCSGTWKDQLAGRRRHETLNSSGRRRPGAVAQAWRRPGWNASSGSGPPGSLGHLRALLEHLGQSSLSWPGPDSGRPDWACCQAPDQDRADAGPYSAISEPSAGATNRLQACGQRISAFIDQSRPVETAQARHPAARVVQLGQAKRSACSTPSRWPRHIQRPLSTTVVGHEHIGGAGGRR